jgi:hypothetical protein
LEGRWRDPRIGRDVLLGLTLGMVTAVGIHVVNGVPTWLPFSHQTPVAFFGNIRWEFRLTPLAAPLDVTLDALQRALADLALLFICRLIVKRGWAAAVMVGILISLFGLGGENPALETPVAVLNGALYAFAVSRLGLLALTAMSWVQSAALALPLGVGLTQWYAPYAALTLVLLLGGAAWAFIAALGGRSPFGTVKLDA